MAFLSVRVIWSLSDDLSKRLGPVLARENLIAHGRIVRQKAKGKRQKDRQRRKAEGGRTERSRQKESVPGGSPGTLKKLVRLVRTQQARSTDFSALLPFAFLLLPLLVSAAVATVAAAAFPAFAVAAAPVVATVAVAATAATTAVTATPATAAAVAAATATTVAAAATAAAVAATATAAAARPLLAGTRLADGDRPPVDAFAVEVADRGSPLPRRSSWSRRQSHGFCR